MKWYRENLNNKKLHPLLFAAEFHYRFIRIHPFDDGNGRIVRILMNLLLMQKMLPPVIVKTKDKENYYRSLQQAESGQLEVFFNYIGEQLTHSLEIMVKAARGEDIEEPEDIDKEIALLKQELSDVEDLREIKNIENVSKVVMHTSKMIFDKILPELRSILDFYREIRFLYIIDEHRFSPSGKNFLEEIESRLSSIGIRNRFAVRFNLIDFKKLVGTPFSDEILFDVDFGQYNYTVSPGKNDSKIVKLYHKKLDEEDIKLIVRENKKSLLKNIKFKLGRK